jgi:hypothetical protein
MATEKKLTDQNVSEIDKAVNAARTRKAAKEGTAATATAEKPAKTPKEPKAPTEPKRPRLSDEEKATRLAAKETARNEKKTARDVARAAKKAERDAAKSPAHLKKVNRAAERLPVLTEEANLQFNEITANFTRDQVAAIALHLTHFNRLAATTRALETKLEAGMNVRIVSGDARFIGKTGTVNKAQRIRAYIDVPGVTKPVYVFSSDCEIVTETASAAKSA